MIEIDFFDANSTDYPCLKAVLMRNEGCLVSKTGIWGALFERDAPNRVLCDI
jgi:hypothetical protein